MSEELFSETISVRVPRWRWGSWRWGPSITVQVKVTFQPSSGFVTKVEGHDIPDYERRFSSLLIRLRQKLLKRSQGMERITQRHLNRVETHRIEREQLRAADPSMRNTAEVGEPKYEKQPTGIFRIPPQEITDRISRMRERTRTPAPEAVAPPRKEALEARRPVIRKETVEAEPTDAITIEPAGPQKPATVFRLDKQEISTRLQRRRQGETASEPKVATGDEGRSPFEPEQGQPEAG